MKVKMNDRAKRKSLKVKTNLKAGALRLNHNETLVRDRGKRKSLRVKTNLKAGAWDRDLIYDNLLGA